MFASVLSVAIIGVKGRLIRVEADVCAGLPAMTMVGYVSGQVREAQERVKAALRNSGAVLPPRRITLNLAPADLRKEGTAFDLPIALALLTAFGLLPKESVNGILAVGELSLNGQLKPVRGVLPIAVLAAKRGIRLMIVPKENRREAEMAGGVRIAAAENLRQVWNWLSAGEAPETEKPETDSEDGLLYEPKAPDFASVCGQKVLRRAAEIAVSGFHNLMMTGPPGAGKSMAAACIPGILPSPSLEECLEISGVYSVAGLLSQERPFLDRRPFRAPHHTISQKAMAGGGAFPRPGEISLAHRGVLFLDELPEFRRETLEILRQPLEERVIRISRARGSTEFPADFMLVAAMNPCPCGCYPDRSRCTCTDTDIKRYRAKISRPLTDRIDLWAEAGTVTFQELEEGEKNEDSKTIRGRVERVRTVQAERYRNTRYRFNGDLDAEGVRRFCRLDGAAEKLMENVYAHLSLSVRGYHRLLKVARTIADMDGEREILRRHLSEAVCYRKPEEGIE